LLSLAIAINLNRPEELSGHPERSEGSQLVRDSQFVELAIVSPPDQFPFW